MRRPIVLLGAAALATLGTGCGSSSTKVPEGERQVSTVATQATRTDTTPPPRRRRGRSRYRIVGTPVLLVGGSEQHGFTGTLLVRTNRSLGLGSGPPRARFLLDGHSDLEGPFANRAFRNCYWQSFYDVLPKPPPKPGTKVTISLQRGQAIETDRTVRVRAGTGGEGLDPEVQRHWFGRLGCPRA